MPLEPSCYFNYEVCQAFVQIARANDLAELATPNWRRSEIVVEGLEIVRRLNFEGLVGATSIRKPA